MLPYLPFVIALVGLPLALALSAAKGEFGVLRRTERLLDIASKLPEGDERTALINRAGRYVPLLTRPPGYRLRVYSQRYLLVGTLVIYIVASLLYPDVLDTSIFVVVWHRLTDPLRQAGLSSLAVHLIAALGAAGAMVYVVFAYAWVGLAFFRLKRLFRNHREWHRSRTVSLAPPSPPAPSPARTRNTTGSQTRRVWPDRTRVWDSAAAVMIIRSTYTAGATNAKVTNASRIDTPMITRRATVRRKDDHEWVTERVRGRSSTVVFSAICPTTSPTLPVVAGQARQVAGSGRTKAHSIQR